MTTVDILLDLLLLTALLLTAHRAWRFPDHRPIALLLGVLLASTIARRLLRLLFFEPRRASLRAVGIDPAAVPLEGLGRALRHLHDALGLVGGWGLVAVAVTVLLRRSARVVIVPYLASLATLVVGYPELRYQRLAVAVAIIHLAQVAIGSVVAAAWLRRRATRIAPNRAEVAVLVMGAFHAALFAPLVLMAQAPRGGAPTINPFSEWYLAQGQYLGLYVSLILIHRPGSWTLWRRRSEKSGTSSSSRSSPSASCSRRSLLSPSSISAR